MSELKTNLQKILQEKENKIIPENIKKNVTIFDITGTYEGSGSSGGGVKLFETEEEMRLDDTAQEGDLAIVYRKETQNMTSNTQTRYITFPTIVTLPEAFTGSAYGMIRSVDEYSSEYFDASIDMSATSFRFMGYNYNDEEITIEYTSSDGITYTRTTEIVNPVDCGTLVTPYERGGWNSNFGFFMKVDGASFDGLYQYGEQTDKNLVSVLNNSGLTFDYDSSSNSLSNIQFGNSVIKSVNIQKLWNIIQAMKTAGDVGTGDMFFYIGKDGELYVPVRNISNKNILNFGFMYDIEKQYIGICEYAPSKATDMTLLIYKINLDAETYELSSTLEPVGNFTTSSGSTTYTYYNIPIQSYPYSVSQNNDTIYTRVRAYIMIVDGGILKISQSKLSSDVYVKYNDYGYAKTQFTALESDVGVDNVFYGRDGIGVGTNTVPLTPDDYERALKTAKQIEGSDT